MSPDLVNGCFELCGAYCTWRNFASYCKDREVAGVYVPATAFFTVWGLWNLYYYTALAQPLSFFAGIALTTGNVMWLAFVGLDRVARR